MRRAVRIGSGPTDSNSLVNARSRPYDGKIAGLYDLEETLGRGHFAVVKLARHVFTGEKVAVKVIDKSRLDDVSKAHLFQEVRCMKLVQHPNVVRLYEVIDTATKLYLILELGDGGDLYEYILRHDTGLPEHVAREYFSQIVRAISYCHKLHVVHRDLKPENVVFFKKLGVVKLTDFGFSNKFYPGQKLETSCGSLAYSAPEILLGDSYDAPAVDVWSLGVILYMLVCGQPPFQEANDSETLTMIMDCKYIIPPHVSMACRDLIARMLVRNPENRATLAEIANHKWISLGKKDNFVGDILPLISMQQLSEEDHNFIVQKIVNGDIATKEEVNECLERNDYNHITATYYLLAERKLRSKRLDQANKCKRPEHLVVPTTSISKKVVSDGGSHAYLLSIPRTPGDLTQRSRKCSIVQEDEEEEDITACSGHEELGTPLNRRGSRSEGRLSLTVQEKLAESDRRNSGVKEKNKDAFVTLTKATNVCGDTRLLKDQKCDAHKDSILKNDLQAPRILIKKESLDADKLVTAAHRTEAAIISIPTVNPSLSLPCSSTQLYKALPVASKSPAVSGSTTPPPLLEISEEGDYINIASHSSKFGNQSRNSYDQRTKFHKIRTASCSSSDASDDDSEKRKKRPHKLNTSAKPFQGRRDSHDDSSDSQEPGTGAGLNGGSKNLVNSNSTIQNHKDTPQSTNNKDGNKTNAGTHERKSGIHTNCISLARRQHKATRRGNNEIRLRESQSLNRITEVQEDTASLVISTTIVESHGILTSNIRGVGARISQGFNIALKKSVDGKKVKNEQTHVSCNDADKIDSEYKKTMSKHKGNDSNRGKTGTKKPRILAKYFQVQKKLCIPIPSFFNKNRLYKAQSCNFLARDRVTINSAPDLKYKQPAVGVMKTSISNDADVNKSEDVKKYSSTVVQLNTVCNELTEICAVHLGHASKCCSF